MREVVGSNPTATTMLSPSFSHESTVPPVFGNFARMPEPEEKRGKRFLPDRSLVSMSRGTDVSCENFFLFSFSTLTESMVPDLMRACFHQVVSERWAAPLQSFRTSRNFIGDARRIAYFDLSHIPG